MFTTFIFDANSDSNVALKIFLTASCFLILDVVMNTTLSGSASGLCAENPTNFGGKSDCEQESTGGGTLYYTLLILGMVVAGAGCTPMIALGIPYMDENVSAKVSPMYVGIFLACGILGEFRWAIKPCPTNVVSVRVFSFLFLVSFPFGGEGGGSITKQLFRAYWMRDVIYQTRETVFHRDFQTPRREFKIRRKAEYFWWNSRCLDSRWNTVSIKTKTKEWTEKWVVKISAN